MIKFRLYDDQDAASQLHAIHKIVESCLKTIMDSNLCHIRSDNCKECSFREVCYDLEELEVWSISSMKKLEDIENGSV